MISPEILFLGNCQVSRFMQFYSRFGTPDKRRTALFRSITPNFGEYHEKETEEYLQTANLAIVQLVLSDVNFNHDRVLALRGGRPTIFVPYVYLPGFRRLEKLSSKGKPYIDGKEILVAAMAKAGLKRGLLDFQNGRIDGQNKQRLTASLAEMHRREALGADVFAASYIEETYRERLPCYSINHPAPHVLFHLYNQIAKMAGFHIIDEKTISNYDYARAVLPLGTSGLTPYCVDALDLKYAHDPHWLSKEAVICKQIIKSIETKAQNAT
jgi:hypothetical protein